MKIRRYLAKDMRQALSQVREQQGPDAVIMSSRRLDDGVEVVAAIDFDVEEAISQTVVESSDDEAHDFANVPRRSNAKQGESAANANVSKGVSDEINALRRMLETQLASLAWNDLSRRAPIHTEVLKELTQFGVTPDLAAELVSQLPARAQLHEAQRMALALWARRIPTIEERWMDQGGTVAMVGPTGVGKTTTLGKLAARWVLRHGTRDIVLISADSVRIGAQDQVQTIGRLLGVPTLIIDRVSELPALLTQWEHRRLVLIDTPGFSPRDPALVPELAALSVASLRLETSLILAASVQAGVNQESLQRFQAAQPKSCVLTKVDEAVSLGGILSAITHAQLPIAYLGEGQR
ncbi:MAG: flagellar biosynthesis protein FlhF, partial [Candidatus Obscuribacterales bacterium]|nr:flagellar biosynthesis protein FlhF [Steroidobacteraceae bacterium]